MSQTRNQHYVPRSVLRAFVSRRTPKDEYAWVARRGGAVFEGNLEGVCAERDFYSAPAVDGARTLDDAITLYENRFNALLDQLRQTPVGSRTDGSAAAEVIGHLTPRGANLRSLFTAGVEGLITSAERLFTDETEVRRILGLNAPAPTAHFRNQFTDRLCQDPRIQALGIPRPAFERLAFALIREALPDLLADQASKTKAELDLYRDLAPGEIARAHQASLKRDLVSRQRASALERLVWSIEPASQAVMPDCGALAIKADGSGHPFLTADRASPVTVVMPLAPDRILVGVEPGAKPPSLWGLNMLAAACSDQFVVSATRNLDDLVDLIGQRPAEFLTDTIGGAVARLGPQPDEAACTAATPEVFNITLTTPDWGDDEVYAELEAALKPIIQTLARLMPLHRLDGIAFALDFDGALAIQDGDVVPELNFISGSRGAGTALYVPSHSDAGLRFRLVMAADYGWALIRQPDPDRRGYALHVLIEELGQIAFQTEIEDRWPNIHTAPLANPLDGDLYAYAAGPVGGFMAARWSAGFGADAYIETELRELFTPMILRGAAALDAARAAYRPGDDIQTLYDAGRSAALEFLTLLGRFVGHRLGQGEPVALEGEMAAVVSAMGLSGWFELYASDLARLWDRRGDWGAFSEISDFGGHVERLLWQFGIFPWVQEDGSLYVSIFDTLGLAPGVEALGDPAPDPTSPEGAARS